MGGRAGFGVWRKCSLLTPIQVDFTFILASMPKLQEFDWRVDVKTSSDTIARMSAPTCLLQLKVLQNRLSVVCSRVCCGADECHVFAFVGQIQSNMVSKFAQGIAHVYSQILSILLALSVSPHTLLCGYSYTCETLCY